MAGGRVQRSAGVLREVLEVWRPVIGRDALGGVRETAVTKSGTLRGMVVALSDAETVRRVGAGGSVDASATHRVTLRGELGTTFRATDRFKWIASRGAGDGATDGRWLEPLGPGKAVGDALNPWCEVLCAEINPPEIATPLGTAPESQQEEAPA
jgi:hypothetical protein